MLSRKAQKHVLAALQVGEMALEHGRAKGVYLPQAIGVNEGLKASPALYP
jgi:hypothetical protein